MPLTKIQSLGITDGTIVNADINASAAIAGTKISGSFGKVLQVVQTVKTDTFTVTSGTFTDITGMSVSITPSSSSNKILVLANVNHVGTTSTASSSIRLLRASTAIAIGDAAGSRTRTSGGSAYGNYGVTLTGDAIMFLDSPATTSSTTYKIQTMCYGGYTAYINRSGNDSDADAYFRSISSITVMEIAI
jgi:hypothetical protein